VFCAVAVDCDWGEVACTVGTGGIAVAGVCEEIYASASVDELGSDVLITAGDVGLEAEAVAGAGAGL
jgi:hypothetical protein